MSHSRRELESDGADRRFQERLPLLDHHQAVQFMKLMGANESVIASLSPRQLEWVEHFIDYMNPASVRYAGAVFDNTAALPGHRIAEIRAPTLVVHAEDDTLQLFHNAAFASSTIPGARLLRFETGGHFVMMIEQGTVRPWVQKHILDNLSELPTERR